MADTTDHHMTITPESTLAIAAALASEAPATEALVILAPIAAAPGYNSLLPGTLFSIPFFLAQCQLALFQI